MEWMTGALCAQANPDLFFAAGAGGPARHEELAAKRICLRCPVLRLCLAWALDSGQAYGVWGATTAEERAALRRQKAATPRFHLSAAER